PGRGTRRRRPRRSPTARRRRRSRAALRASRPWLRRGHPGAARARHAEARTRRCRRRDGRPRRPVRGADASGFPRSGHTQGVRRRCRRRDRLCLSRRGRRRASRVGRGRFEAAEGDHAGGPRARRVVALKAVVFDVGETLVDEERWWRRLADREGLQPHVVWAALGVTIARGEEHEALWGHLGIEQPPRWWHDTTYSL